MNLFTKTHQNSRKYLNFNRNLNDISSWSHGVLKEKSTDDAVS